MSHASYAALLSPAAPQEIRALLAGFLEEREGLTFALCDSVEQHGAFVELALVREGSASAFRVSIPVSCVLAIALTPLTKAGEISFLRTKPATCARSELLYG